MPPAIQIDSLLRRVAESDSRALGELYDATARYVFGILRRMLWSAESAEEVAQEVYLQVWRTARAFDSERGSGWSWLALLARTRAIDRIRAEGSYRTAVENLLAQGEESVPHAASDPPAHEAVVAGERAEWIRLALSELPGDQRRAVELAFFGGLTHREIAERTETPLGTVKTRIRSAILKIRDRLEPEMER